MRVALAGGSLLSWLESSSLAMHVRESVWFYPIVEIVHIAGFSILVGAVVLFDLRLLGFSKKLPVKDCMRYLIFWAKVSFAAVLSSGFILFMVDATVLASNPAFLLKLALIGAAILNAFFFQRFTLQSVDLWNADQPSPPAAKLAGILSILLWIAVISCGRLIAYI